MVTGRLSATGPSAWHEKRQRLAFDTLPNGVIVSTIYIGYGTYPFETLVFKSKNTRLEMDGACYKTEEKAQEGHFMFVTEWKNVDPLYLKSK